MNTPHRFHAMILAVALSICWNAQPGFTADTQASPPGKSQKRITHAQRQKAADLARQKGFTLPKLDAAAPAASTSTMAAPSALAIAPAAVALPGQAPRYFSHPNYANSPLPVLDVNGNPVAGTGIRKFVDGLPGLTIQGQNNLGQFIPVAKPDTTTYAGSDYYEIGVVQYRKKNAFRPWWRHR